MRFMRIWLVLGIVIVLLTGCGGDDTTEEEGEQATPLPPSPTTSVPTELPLNPTLPPTLPSDSEVTLDEQRGSVRLVHALVGVDDLNIQLDGEYVLRGLDPASSSRSIGFQTGEMLLRITDQGSGQQILEQPITIEADDSLLLVVSGTQQSPTLRSFEPDTNPVEPGKTRLSFLHVADDIGPIRVSEDDTVLAEDLNLGELSAPVDVAAQTHTLNFFEDTILRANVSQDFETGRSYMLVFLYDGIVVVDNPTPPQTKLRVIHASPDAPPLRVLLNGQVLVDGLIFTEIVDFQQFPSGRYALEVIDVETGQQMRQLNFTLQEQAHTELVIFGRDNDLEVQTVIVDPTPLPEGQVRLTVFNAVIGVSRITVFSGDEQDYELAARYGQASSIKLEQQRISFVFQNSDDEIVEQPAIGLTLEEGKSYFYVVVGRPATEVAPIVTTFEVGLESPAGELGDFGQPVSVRVINFWDEPIELHLNDQRVALGVPPGGISPAAAIQPATYAFNMFNDRDVLLREGESFLYPEYRQYLYYVFPGPDGAVVTGVPDVDNPPGLGVARVRFVHAHPDLPQLLIGVMPGNTQQQQLDFGDVSGTMDVQSGLNTFQVTDMDALSELITFERINLVGGRRYEMLILPDDTGGVKLEIIERSDGS